MSTLYEKLIEAGLPVISATDEGEVSMLELDDEQGKVFQDVIAAWFDPQGYADRVESELERKSLLDNLDATVSHLGNIISMTSTSNDDLLDALRFIAATQRMIIRVVARS